MRGLTPQSHGSLVAVAVRGLETRYGSPAYYTRVHTDRGRRKQGPLPNRQECRRYPRRQDDTQALQCWLSTGSRRGTRYPRRPDWPPCDRASRLSCRPERACFLSLHERPGVGLRPDTGRDSSRGPL